MSENFLPGAGIYSWFILNNYSSVNLSVCANGDDKRNALCWHSVCRVILNDPSQGERGGGGR